ncbi:hypothetical protein [Kaistella jeonii]|uniref:Uncharacterized protein n=1 Tax=Kaistella jeonii TaxID=266749 RepID=A0A0C1FQQ2_9FLAO|nr:hypothetical protein [Kaistella jeonii]KIA90199.1 hypothetical protein OA86_06350 [Kaistella jeonii]SFB76432.1 hypothetical protein SAMN05421876_10210 [Kaistella jeonii]VEI96493.1 Uncharacterised protein [Kaistella jeonii]
MKNTIGKKISLAIILTNLTIGNGILFFGGKSSFGESVNYPLMAGMSIACIVFYIVFFKYSNFEIYGRLKLILLSVLSCMIIIFIGNFFALLIKEPINEVLSNIPATIFMGIMGNILMFPISLILGLTNFGIITYFTQQ